MFPGFLVEEYVILSAIVILATLAFGLVLGKAFYNMGVFVWIILTIAYVIHRPLPFFILSFLIIQAFCAKRPEISRLGYYFLLLPIVPLAIFYTIPLPGFESLFNLTFPRLLSLAIPLPIFFVFIIQPKKSIFSNPIDKYVIVFLIYITFSHFRFTSLTNGFRSGFYLFLDYFLIYFALSRVIEREEDFKRLFYPMVFAAFILALIAIFEAFQHRHLFADLENVMGAMAGMAYFYLVRMDVLRASAAFTPIALGTYLCLMTTLAVFLKYSRTTKVNVFLSIVIGFFIAGIIATISRGAIIGCFVFFFIFTILALKKAIRIVPMCILLSVVLSAFPFTYRIVSAFPFKGEEEQRNIVYRQRLFNGSISVIKRNLLLGSEDYLKEPEMQELATQDGFIDIVNSYIQVTLRYGLVGLVLLAVIFIRALYGIFKQACFGQTGDMALLGKIIFAMIFSFCAMIFSVSLVTYLPFYMWFLFGLGAAYIRCSGRLGRG